MELVFSFTQLLFQWILGLKNNVKTINEEFITVRYV